MKRTNYSNIYHFFEENKDQIFRYWKKKEIFTPYEWENKFCDQGVYENDEADYGYLYQIIELPDGDLLLGFSYEKSCGYVEYLKLSEISLAWSESDQDE